MEFGIYAGIAFAAAGISYWRARAVGGDTSPDAQTPRASVHFGVPLADAPMSTRVPDVPAAVAVLVALIRPHVHLEGIFRVAGEKASVNALRAAVEALPPASVERAEHDPAEIAATAGLDAAEAEQVGFVAAGVLKSWLRELPLEDKILRGADLSAARARATSDDVRAVVAALPRRRQAVLRVLMRLGAEVTARSEQNLMTSEAFAICLAPALYEDPDLKDPGACVRDSVRA